MALITRSQYFGLLKPLTNGGSGLMSIWPIALVSPASLSCGKYFAGRSSMLVQPRPLAVLMNSSMGQYFSKHQWTIDWWIRPFLAAGPCSAGGRHGRSPAAAGDSSHAQDGRAGGALEHVATAGSGGILGIASVRFHR